MPKTVVVPGHGDVEFPDGMSDEQIVAAIQGLDAPKPEDQHGTAANLGIGALKGLGHTLNSIGSVMLPDALVSKMGMHVPTEQDKAIFNPHGTAQQIGHGVEQAGEFLIPGIGEEKGAAMVAEHLPQLGKMAAPIARIATQSLGAGAINKAQGGSFKGGAAMGAVGGAGGELAKVAAPAVAESSQGIRGIDRDFHRSPGRFMLDETKGFSPAKVESSARAKVNDLTGQLNQSARAAGDAGAEVSLEPHRQFLAGEKANAMEQNSPDFVRDINDVSSQLSHRIDGEGRFDPSNPIPSSVKPWEALQLNRGVGNTVGNWTAKAGASPAVAPTKQLYGSLARDIHGVVPGSEDLASRISSGIPVVDRAHTVMNNAGGIQQALGKFAKPTGALAAPLTGAAIGAHQDGIRGAVIGGVGGLMGTGIIASPTAEMAVARGFNSPLTRDYVLPGILGAGRQLASYIDPSDPKKPEDQ